MKINCSKYHGKTTTHICITCRHYFTCILLQPIYSKEHSLLIREINYWRKELKNARKRLKEYDVIMKEIEEEKFPKENALGVEINRPEHVNYGWNLHKLKRNENEIMEKLRNLQMEELEIRREYHEQ